MTTDVLNGTSLDRGVWKLLFQRPDYGTLTLHEAVVDIPADAATDLERRIDQAAKYAPLEQLCLSPQCGFASTEEGNLLAEDEQWAKLGRCVEVAREVWG